MNRAAHAVVALLVDANPPDELGTLLASMRPWCVAVADERGVEPAAYVATSPRAPNLQRALRSGTPLAVWARDDDEAARARALGATVLLTSGYDVALAGDVIRIPNRDGVDVDDIPSMPPFVRQGLRRARGLPDRLVIDFRSTGLDADLWPTALKVCSACVAAEDLLLTALAWGAPTATTAESAASVGARDGIEVAVAPYGELLRAAEAVADDPAHAAALSRGGRRLAEARYSASGAATSVADRLGLMPSGPDETYAHLEAALTRLHTPSTSFIRTRARRALIPFRN